MSIAQATVKHHSSHRAPNKKWLWGKRILTGFFFLLIPFLLYMVFKNIEWQDVKEAIHAYEAKTLLVACLVCAIAFLVFSSYDLLALHYTKHPIQARKVMPPAFVGCAFSLNLAWVGGVATRFRLYTRMGLDTVTITKLISMNVVTNWLGYTIIAAIIFSSGLLALPENWKIGSTALQIIGVILFFIACGYFYACRFSKRRSFRIFKHKLHLPNLQFALLQASLASINWCLMALIIYTLLFGKIAYPTVLGILLLSALAGVILHVPAGLGVTEAVFLAMLSHQIPKGTIIAALICYRVIYYLLPLAVACVIYLILELRSRNIKAKEGDS